MRIELLGFPTTLGMPRKALRHGPEALRAMGLVDHLQRQGLAVDDLGDITLPEGRKSDPRELQVRKTVDAAKLQMETWLARHQSGSLMTTIGGDHSTSLGTIWALSQMGQSFDVVWIDAHGDFNTLETTPSGNTHGMPLAMACGLMPEYVPQLMSPADLRLWGIRSLDEGEQRLLAEHKVEVLSPDQIRHELERAVKRLKPNVFLSFDIDSVDPVDAPGTGTPVPGGLRRHEALELVAYIARRRHLVALDIVEYHPDLDQGQVTGDLTMAVLDTAVTGQMTQQGRYGLSAAAGN
ncbi:MAG: arginase [Mycobacterium leprae]